MQHDRPTSHPAPRGVTWPAADYYHRRHLEHTFFQTDFQQFCVRILQNFSKISQLFLKYENLDISLSKIIEILRNSGKNPFKFDEKTAKSAASSENQQKLHEILQKMVPSFALKK